jgi:hypothetical protein
MTWAFSDNILRARVLIPLYRFSAGFTRLGSLISFFMNKGIFFDMDGVLIDAMLFHAEAMRLAIKEETKHDINNKVVYLLEGLPGWFCHW